MDNLKEASCVSTLGVDLGEDIVEDIYKDFPKCSLKFIERLKEVFDIRKMVHYKPSTEYLKGVQDVLDFIELSNKKIN